MPGPNPEYVRVSGWQARRERPMIDSALLAGDGLTAHSTGGISVPLPPRLVAFDLETSGIDVEADRIVTAFVGLYEVAEDRFTEQHHWVIDPGVEIPEAAAAVHGYSTEDARFAGLEAATGVFRVAQRLDIWDRQGIPIAAYNARFDFTLLDREYRRHFPGGRPFAPRAVIDPFVLDKADDPWRKGSRKLVDVCRHHRVPVEANAHDAAADCLMTARLAVALLRRPGFATKNGLDLHRYQTIQAARQARSFAGYLVKNGRRDEAALIRGEWPIVPVPQST